MEIKNIFKKIGIKKNDTVILHGDAGVVAQLKTKKNKLNFFFDKLIQILGKNGNILVPAFTYSSCKKKYFDKKKDNSEIGLFSEVFRKRKKVRRTEHPIFSFCVHGKKFSYFNKASLSTCFGKNSIFELFLKSNAKILCLGCSLDRITFTHYAEELIKVDYRFYKIFKIFCKANRKIISTEYFVRKPNIRNNINLDILYKYLKKKNRIKENNFGRYKVISVQSKSFFKSCLELLKKNKYSLIKRN